VAPIGESYRYSNLEPASMAASRAASGAWASVDLVLAMRLHFDHFDAGAVATHLDANPGAVFAGSEQAAEGLREAAPRLSTRIRGDRPAEEGSGVLEEGRFRVRFLDLPHGGTWRGHIENVGLVVEVDGVRILHLGDAATEAALYRALNDDVPDIDLLLAPFWYLREPEGALVLGELVEAPGIVAMHLEPQRDRGPERAVTRDWPGVGLFCGACAISSRPSTAPFGRAQGPMFR
jgi:L-ascorbate metabolism protein UlaG (beta-lactamase superfamily)